MAAGLALHPAVGVRGAAGAGLCGRPGGRPEARAVHRGARLPGTQFN